MACSNPLRRAIRNTAAKSCDAGLKSGKIDAFMCPIVAQDGKTVECKGGDRLTDEQVVGMNFYVQGIEGTIPK